MTAAAPEYEGTVVTLGGSGVLARESVWRPLPEATLRAQH